MSKYALFATYNVRSTISMLTPGGKYHSNYAISMVQILNKLLIST